MRSVLDLLSPFDLLAIDRSPSTLITMLGAVRRFGVAQALKAPVSRSLITRSTPQPLKWQPSSRTAALPQIYRSFHVSSSLRSAQAAEAQTVDTESTPTDRITEFADLAKNGLIDPKIISTITRGMKITTMTDVQSMTINETLRGDDVYVFFTPALFQPYLL